MRLGVRRVLPGVVVGGLLLSGLALGTGVAVAGTPDLVCTVGGVVGVVDGSNCKSPLGKILGLVTSPKTTTAPTTSSKAPSSGGGVVGGVVGGVSSVLPKATPKSSSGGSSSGGSSSGGSSSGGSTSTGSTAGRTASSAAPAGAPAAAPPPAVTASPTLLSAPAPFSASALLGNAPVLGGSAPPALVSSLFGANTYDPNLLLNAPGTPATRYTPRADSAVTTASSAQALGLPASGYSTPITLGVIVLACLIAFAVRHRVVRRLRARETAAG